MWRARGDFGFEAQIDYLMDMSRLLEIFLYITYNFPSFTSLCDDLRCTSKEDKYPFLHEQGVFTTENKSSQCLTVSELPGAWLWAWPTQCDMGSLYNLKY